jgi:23S rRNA pseudouridine1911/1915/1917 synthase
MAVHSIHRKYRAIVHGCFREDKLPQAVSPKERPFLTCEWESAGQDGKELRFCVRGNIGRDKNDRKKMTVVDAASGKPAVTHVTVLRIMKEYSYIECELETGRTHQIRVHMAHIGHPVLGDPVYGPARCPVKGLEGQTLHAMTLGFIHPGTGKYLECTAELPEYFQKLLKTLP